MRQIDFMLAEGSFSQAVRFVCLVPRGKFEHPGWKNIEVQQIGLNAGNLWEQLDLPLHAQGEILFSPANIGPCYYPNQVVTFHDASVFAVPQAYSWAFREKYTFIFKQLSQNARLILTDSHFSQQELARYLEVSPERFTVVPPGCDHLDHIQPDAQIVEQYHLTKNSYLLIMAGQRPHKNLHALFEALKLLETDIRIVVVGKNPKQVFQSSPANIKILGD